MNWKGKTRGWEASEEVAIVQGRIGEVSVKMEGSRQSWAITQVRNCQNMGLHLTCAGGTGDRSQFPDSATWWDRHIWNRSTF